MKQIKKGKQIRRFEYKLLRRIFGSKNNKKEGTEYYL
jgi:hypothetical protein